ncbi:hypothetical protein HDU97_006931 [Phlyctochytrium planicorne]|nr:hypothetical protein HDU97_006931 [Phlyctochytrium planicorne]
MKDNEPAAPRQSLRIAAKRRRDETDANEIIDVKPTISGADPADIKNHALDEGGQVEKASQATRGRKRKDPGALVASTDAGDAKALVKEKRQKKKTASGSAAEYAPMPRGAPSIVTLPEEIPDDVLKNLDHPADLCRLACTCKRLAKLADESIAWKKFASKCRTVPSAKAKKYRTWKSVLAKDWDHICLKCFDYHDKRFLLTKAKSRDISDDNSLIYKCCKRRVALRAALRARGLELRSDSKLCQDFISYGSGTLDGIVTTMLESYTQYFSWEDGYDRWGRERKLRHRTRVNSDEEKRRALDEWCRNRVEKQNFRSPSLDPESPDRPPQSLWDRLDQILRAKISEKFPGSELELELPTAPEQVDLTVLPEASSSTIPQADAVSAAV